MSLAKSSSASAFPILLQVNELPPLARSKRMLLAGIYIGKKKPKITSLLRPIISQLHDLYETGIKWYPNGPEHEEIVSKFATLVFTADAVAKPEALRMSPHNSYYLCPR